MLLRKYSSNTEGIHPVSGDDIRVRSVRLMMARPGRFQGIDKTGSLQPPRTTTQLKWYFSLQKWSFVSVHVESLWINLFTPTVTRYRDVGMRRCALTLNTYRQVNFGEAPAWDKSYVCIASSLATSPTC